MTREDYIHTIGNIGYKLTRLISVPFSNVDSWLTRKSIAIRDWQEKNHACCTRHGYTKNLKG